MLYLDEKCKWENGRATWKTPNTSFCCPIRAARKYFFRAWKKHANTRKESRAASLTAIFEGEGMVLRVSFMITNLPYSERFSRHAVWSTQWDINEIILVYVQSTNMQEHIKEYIRIVADNMLLHISHINIYLWHYRCLSDCLVIGTL